MTDTAEVCEITAPRQSRIGLVAYCALGPTYVFVRVPNEPGRWLITLRCVVEVPCPYCKSVEGEPCRNTRSGHYWTSTHTDRRKLFSKHKPRRSLDQHKPRLSLNDLRDATAEAPP